MSKLEEALTKANKIRKEEKNAVQTVLIEPEQEEQTQYQRPSAEPENGPGYADERGGKSDQPGE